MVGVNSPTAIRQGCGRGIGFAVPVDNALTDILLAAPRQRAASSRGKLGVRHPAHHSPSWPKGLGLERARAARWSPTWEKERPPGARAPASCPATSSPRSTAPRVKIHEELPRMVCCVTSRGRRWCWRCSGAAARATLNVVVGRARARDASSRAARREPQRRSRRRVQQHRSGGVRSDRRAEARAQGQERRHASRPPRARPRGPGSARTTSSCSVDNVEVTSAKQFERRVAKLDKAKPVTMLIRQGDVAKFVIVRPRDSQVVCVRSLTNHFRRALAVAPELLLLGRDWRRSPGDSCRDPENCPQAVHSHLWTICG